MIAEGLRAAPAGVLAGRDRGDGTVDLPEAGAWDARERTVPSSRQELEAAGATIIRQALSLEAVAEIAAAFPTLAPLRAGQRGYDPPPAIRAAIAPEGAMGRAAADLAGSPMRAVRVVLFDKTPETNWGVPWHQDRTVSVREKHDVEGFSAWNVKGGVTHVEPPVELLQEMLTLRLFVDDCDVSNGPVRIALGSHKNGRIPAAEAGHVARACEILEATGSAGDLLAMRLLAVHASEPAREPSRRRVLHVDYAPRALPAPLAWAFA